MQTGLVRLVCPWGVAVVASCVTAPALSQAVDIEPASLSVGAPLNVTVRVRPDGTQTAPLPPHCLEAEIVTDGLLLPAGDIRILTQRDAAAGWTRVRLSHPHRQQGPDASVTLILKCGSTFERQFSVLTKTGADERPRGGSDRASIRRHLGTVPRSATSPAAIETQAANNTAQAPEPTASQRQQETFLAPEVSPAFVLAEKTEQPASNVSLARRDAVDEPAPGSTRAAPPAPTADPQKLQADLVRLQAEHQRALSEVATLRSRLTHEELSPSRTSWAFLLGLLALSLVQLNRWTSNRRPAPRAAAKALALPKSAAPAVSPALAGQAPAQRRIEGVHQAAGPGTSRVAATAQAPGSRWHDADFGRPTFSDEGVRPMLREVELLIEQGYPAAATLTLEQHLMSQEGKHPAVLLSLFDLYGDMGQPWNRERVGAQLEALYNVQGALNGDDAPGATRASPALEDCRASLDRIVRTWGGTEGRSALGSLLLRPAAVEPLPLAAFREAVWLHGLRAELDRPTHSAADTGELTLEPMTTA